MGNYTEDYRLATREEKLAILIVLGRTATEEEKIVLAKETKRVLQLPRTKGSILWVA